MSDKGMTISEISQKFKISAERVRQVLVFEPNYCLKHSKYFKDICPYCEVEITYKEMYQNRSLDELEILGKELRKLKRDKVEVIKKRIFTRIMKDKYNFNFSEIAKLLRKDRTTIMNLYYNG